VITDVRLFQIFHPDRGFLYVNVRSAGFSPGEVIPPIEKIYQWLAPAHHGDWWHLSSVESFLDDERCPIDRDGVVIVPAPFCSCCGLQCRGDHHLTIVRTHLDPRKRSYRCAKHADRNPCAIEGCERTRAADGYFADDQTLCPMHWRMFVPPRGPLRRCYHRIWRQQKKNGGWSPQLIRRFEVLWDAIIRRARSRAAGDVDMTEINKMFGWGE